MRVNTWAIGLFLILGTGIFATILFLIGNRHDVFGKHAEFYSEFSDVGGLPNGAEVRVAGFEAGEVKGIQVPTGSDSKFRLKLQVRASIRGMIHADSVVSIKTEGIVGDKYISIEEGTKTAPAAQDGATLPSREPFDMGAMLERSSALLSNVDRSVTDVRGRLDVALDSVTKTVTHVDGLVAAVQPDIRKMAANASQVTGTLNDIVADLQAGRGPAGLFLKDEATRRQLEATMSNIHQASVNLNDASMRGDHILADVESRDLVSSVKVTLDNVQALSKELRQGVARALGPDDLGHDGATNIRETLSNLSRGTSNLADDTDALKHEFFFRGFFKKRGFYDLEQLAPADYVKACEKGESCRSRAWLDAPDLFAAGNEGKVTLTENGRSEIDHAVSPFIGSLPDRIVIVEGYCSAGTADQRFVVARERAELVRQYLEAHFHLLHRDLGVVSLGDRPPRNTGRSMWNGVGIVFFGASQNRAE
jgi:phospholipid/cholesterol/gamma-HCH transport system substrate-binding protein